MVDQVNNNDIVDAGNTIADILTLINDNVIEQGKRIGRQGDRITNIFERLDELKEADPTDRDAIQVAVVEELNGRDILDTDGVRDMLKGDDFIDGVVEVINDYDMSGKIEDELYNSDYVTGSSFDNHLSDHGVAYSHELEDMINEDDVRDTVEAMLFDRKLKEAENSDPDLYDIHMKNIGRQAVEAFKAEQAKLKEEKESADRSRALPPLPQPSKPSN